MRCANIEQPRMAIVHRGVERERHNNRSWYTARRLDFIVSVYAHTNTNTLNDFPRAMLQTHTHTHTGACNSTIEWWKIMEYIIKTCAVCWQNSVQFRVFDCLPRSSLLRHMLEWVGACFDFAFSIYWPAALHKTLQCSRFSAWIRMLSCITKANNAELLPFLWIMPYRRTKKCMNQFHIARKFDE